ncbi:MAG: CHAT domain-containing protein, partial [Planctomycetota bacterium]
AGSATKFIICGDGQIAQLPWSTLPTDQEFTTSQNKKITGRLIDQFQFINCISLASLDLDKIQQSRIGNRITVFSNIDFGAASEQSATKWNPLNPQTEELTAIENCFSEKSILKRTGTEATKTAWESNTSSSLIHFSTHGFYLPSSAKSAADGIASRFVQSDNIYRRNPWVSCGLVFAGANQSGQNSILLGEEIVGRSLADTDLVVLATCRSGEGEVFDGEGGYGIQHAFLLAGAKCTIGSYWSVSDQKTGRLMRHFYGQLAQGLSASDALHQTQQHFRQEGLGAQHWGAWMVSGQWFVSKFVSK